VGVAAGAHLEWFVHPRIAIQGRTGVDFGWSSLSSSLVITDYDGSGAVLYTQVGESTSSGFDFGTASFGLGLIGYF